MKSIPAELSKPLTVEDVRKIFGFTQPEDLSELLKKCPRHYIRSYYAQIYLGSQQNTNDIRSNNDGYLRNQIIRAIEGAGIVLGGVSKGGKKRPQQSAGSKGTIAEMQGASAQGPITPPLPKPAIQKTKPAARNVIYLQANGSLAGFTPGQPKQDLSLDGLSRRGLPSGSHDASRGQHINYPVNTVSPEQPIRQRTSQAEAGSIETREQRTANAEAGPSAEEYHRVIMGLMAADRRQAALQNPAMLPAVAAPYARPGFARQARPEALQSLARAHVLPHWRHAMQRQAEIRMLNSWMQAMPQLQQLGRIDPQVMAGVLQAQPQLINRVHQHAASQQLLQALAMQMQMPENPATSMPTPIIASPIASKPREHTEAKLDEDGKTLQPQISLEAAKVQRLGASMGTKLRPESAQKIQDEAAAKVQSEFLRGDFEDMLQPSESHKITSRSCSETSSKQGQARRRDRVSKDTAQSLQSQDISGGNGLALPSSIAVPVSAVPAARHTFSGGTETWSPPDRLNRPIAIPSVLWQPYKRPASGDEGLAVDPFKPAAAHSPSTSPEPALVQLKRGHSRSEADLLSFARSKRSGRKLAKGRRRPRSQQRDRHESAFTRVGPKIRSPKKRPARPGQGSKLQAQQEMTSAGKRSGGDMLEQQIASDRSNSLLRSPDEEGNGAETSAFAALLDAAEAMQMEETSLED